MQTSNPNVIFYGHICIDRNEIAGEKITESPGSPSYFGAITLGTLNIPSLIISPWGSDYPSAWKEKISLIPTSPTAKNTLVYENSYDDHGTRTLGAYNQEGALPILPSEIPGSILKNCQVFSIAPLVANIPAEFIQTIHSKLNSSAKLVCMPQGFFRRIDESGNVSKGTWKDAHIIAPLCDFIFVSEEDSEDMDQNAHMWSLQKSIVLVTRSEKGCSVYEKGHRVDFPAFTIETVVDPVGAGDVFASAFLFYSMRGKSIAESAVFANAAGALSVECHISDLCLTEEKIDEFIKSQKHYPVTFSK